MNKLFFVSIFFLNIFLTQAQKILTEPSIIGGMFYGTGNYKVYNDYNNFSLMSRTLGGRLSFLLNKNIMIGGKGSSMSINYDKYSYFKISRGGLSLEFINNYNRFYFSGGIYSGFGSIRNLHIINNQNSLYIADIQKRKLIFFSPSISIYFRLNEKIAISFISDYLFDISAKYKSNMPQINKQISGFDVKFGLMFFR